MAAKVPRKFRGPIASEGAKIDRWSRRKYGISGPRLLAKLGQGESGFKANRTSYAGAREEFQFIPSTRNAILKETGADAYGSPASKTRAARILLRRGGLRGYNPGDPSYPAYILHQAVSLQGVLDAAAAGRHSDSFTFRNTKVSTTPGVDRGDERRKAILSYVLAQSHQSAGALTLAGVDPKPYYGQQGLQALAATLGGLSDTPSKVKVTSSNRKVTIGGSGGGSVKFAPGADRPGVHTTPAVKKFVRKVSGLAGEPLTVGTGTQHSHMTVNGNVSDHWSGHAGDIPATGKKLIRLGQLALIAAGMPRKQALKQRGGLYNVGGHQIIFNTHEGGDHTNHLHVSAY